MCHICGMTNPRKPAATVQKIERTPRGGERLTIRNQDGSTKTLITSASTTKAIKRAVKSIPRTLKSLADK
jgi:hypothetical protein